MNFGRDSTQRCGLTRADWTCMTYNLDDLVQSWRGNNARMRGRTGRHLHLHVVPCELISLCIKECLWRLDVPAAGPLVDSSRGHSLGHAQQRVCPESALSWYGGLKHELSHIPELHMEISR